jgi:hypothetical protein
LRAGFYWGVARFRIRPSIGARELQAKIFRCEITDIADDGRNDFMRRATERGEKFVADVSGSSSTKYSPWGGGPSFWSALRLKPVAGSVQRNGEIMPRRRGVG